MFLSYGILFFITAALTFGLTVSVKKIMIRLGIVDRPAKKRKIHDKIIPLGGGLALFLGVFIVLGYGMFAQNKIPMITVSEFLALFLGGLIIMVGGILDDAYNFSPAKQLFFTISAILVVVFFGIGPTGIGNPFTGEITDLTRIAIERGASFRWEFLPDIFLFVWLFTMMYATKVMDGLDGLVTGIVFIGAIMIFLLTQSTLWFQPEISALSSIFAGACLGFLFLNFYPASIFLGEAGSVFLGFMLGGLAVLSGSKIAIAMLVMAIPVIDIVRVVMIRLKKGNSIFAGDSEHFHYQLLGAGYAHKNVVIILYAVALVSGLAGLFLNHLGKTIVFGLLIFCFVLVNRSLGSKMNKKNI